MGEGEVISNGLLLGPDRTKRNDFVKYEGITKAGEYIKEMDISRRFRPRIFRIDA